MTKRFYDVEITATVRLEVDDEITSEFYPGETILTAHANRERFIEGSTVETALTSLAVSLGIDGRDISRVDGWADFPDGAASSSPYAVDWDWTGAQVHEVTPS